MCRAIPMQVVTRNSHSARCRVKGVERDVSLSLLRDEPVSPGDYLLVHLGMVHLGRAVQKISAREAQRTWAPFDHVLSWDAPHA